MKNLIIIAILVSLFITSITTYHSCINPKIDLSDRDEQARLPICLIVEEKEEMVQKAIDEVNSDLEKPALRMTNCDLNDNFVELKFVNILPEVCGQRGCVITSRKNGKITHQEVQIKHEAPYSTTLHELRHLLGCDHGDMGKPCYMGNYLPDD